MEIMVSIRMAHYLSIIVSILHDDKSEQVNQPFRILGRLLPVRLGLQEET